MADNLVPGIPYVHLRWDDSYVYYYQPIPVKFEAADLITKVQAENELKDAGVDVSSEGITGYTITRNVIYNTLLNSFQLRPDFLVTGTRLSDIEIISPRDNRRIIDGEGHDVWIENSIGGEIPVIEMSLPCTNEEYLGTNVPVNSVVMTDTQGMGFSVAFKFYDTPVEVKKRLQSEIYREVDERYKQPVLLVDMRVKRRDYTSGRETYVWFELRYYVDGRVVLLKFGETVEDFYKKFIERYPWLALILSRQSSVWATSFTSFDLKYAKNLEELFGVASATWEGWNQSTLGKVFHTIYCQVIDDTLTIHPLPQKELIWDKGIKASLVTKEEEVKNKSNISWCFDEIDLGCTFSSIVFYLSKAYFKSGYVGSFPHVVDKVFGKELNVTTYQGCVSNGPGDLERYIIPRLVSREVLYSNLERYEFNLSLLTNTSQVTPTTRQIELPREDVIELGPERENEILDKLVELTKKKREQGLTEEEEMWYELYTSLLHGRKAQFDDATRNQDVLQYVSVVAAAVAAFITTYTQVIESAQEQDELNQRFSHEELINYAFTEFIKRVRGGEILVLPYFLMDNKRFFKEVLKYLETEYSFPLKESSVDDAFVVSFEYPIER